MLLKMRNVPLVKFNLSLINCESDFYRNGLLNKQFFSHQCDKHLVNIQYNGNCLTLSHYTFLQLVCLGYTLKTFLYIYKKNVISNPVQLLVTVHQLMVLKIFCRISPRKVNYLQKMAGILDLCSFAIIYIRNKRYRKLLKRQTTFILHFLKFYKKKKNVFFSHKK